jgi:hypothetical protein
VINSIKVFGERHCGTNAIGYFAGQNFNLQTKRHDLLGWKHRLAPERAEWSKFDVESCLFIFCLRNPYSWLQAMHKEPYYEHYPKIKELSFKNFLKFSIEDYENSIVMWNKKNLSYQRMAKEVPNAVIVKVEEFHSSQEKIHADLKQILGVDNSPVIPMNEYVNGRGRHADKDIQSALAIPSFKKDITELIHTFLSDEVMEQCNYIKV